MYWKRLVAALQGKDMPCDCGRLQPVRDAQYAEAMHLLQIIPPEIPGSDEPTSAENLTWMMRRCIHEIDTFPVDKTGRWIGFVHGVLALAKFLDVNETRNRTRAGFQAAYKATGQAVPKTMDLVIIPTQ